MIFFIDSNTTDNLTAEAFNYLIIISWGIQMTTDWLIVALLKVVFGYIMFKCKAPRIF